MFGIWSYVAMAAIAMSVLGGTYWKGYTSGGAAVTKDWNSAKAQQVLENDAAKAKSLADERDLQARSDALQKAKNAKIHSLELTVAESLRRLRNRPERPAAGTDVPEHPGAGGEPKGCTGAGLYKGDGEFLTRLAADADKLRFGLARCETQYREAREKSLSK